MAGRITPHLRSTWRIGVFLAILAGAFTRSALRRGHRTPAGRAEWLRDTCRRIVAGIDLEIRAEGPPIERGLLVSNHLSYLDIVVLGSLHPSAFLSKLEVKSWPVIGWGARAAGTLFVRRQNRADIAAAAKAIRDLLAAGGSVMVFPEGTSSGGAAVLPFHPGVFESVAGSSHRITPVWIAYTLEDGDPAEDVCYWRDMTFAPHFFKLLGKKRVVATVRVGPVLEATADRKQLARAARAQVMELAGQAVDSGEAPTRPEVLGTR